MHIASLQRRARKTAQKSAALNGEASSGIAHGLYFFHISNDKVEKHYQRLVRETEGQVIWHRVFNPGNRASPRTELDYQHPSLTMPRRYEQMEQAGGIVPAGLADLAIFPSVLATAAPFVWVLEFDVDYAGNWREFFTRFENNQADLLTTNLASHRDNPEWVRWRKAKHPKSLHPANRLRSFTPLMRFSNRFASSYVKALNSGEWGGHYEFTIPTIASMMGYTIEDLGNVGRLCPRERRGKIYSSTTNHPELTPGTFVWRPAFDSYCEDEPSTFTQKDMLYHPIKAGGIGQYNWLEAEKEMRAAQAAIAKKHLSTAVVMATFNGSRYLNAQLKTLVEQTHLPDRLIVSDDKSSDDTLDLVRAFARTAPFAVEIIENAEHRGYSGNFIEAVKRVEEDLIFFCDQDDMWYEDKIHLVINAARENSELAFSHDLTIFHRAMTKKKGRIPSYFDHLRRLNLSASICSKGCGLAVRKELLEELGWPDPEAGISYDGWLTLLTTALNQRALIEAPLVKHRIHDTNASGWIVTEEEARRKAKASPEAPFASMLDFYMMNSRKGWIKPLQEKLETVGKQINPEQADRAIELLEQYL
ncbi:glycosyltransferase [uncultured Cohaesibacter sp.]|uniref:glycosyltransferase n=1 Tax=uncultured Cohaesibacter sp. TaxID=1002546 RepID=UPI0029C72887|nr:glycosyltransferase [uncultured Cohaesibacter sp.]